jgi:hypothetical protein
MSDAMPPPPPGFDTQPGVRPPLPPGYGSSADGGVRDHPGATPVMIWPFIWARARGIRTEMNAEPGVFWSNRGNVTTAIVCSAIGTLLIPIALLLVGVYVMVGGRFG